MYRFMNVGYFTGAYIEIDAGKLKSWYVRIFKLDKIRSFPL